MLQKQLNDGRLRARIERLENRLMPESSDRLPLAVFRHLADGSLSPWELRRWSAVIAEIRDDGFAGESLSLSNTHCSHHDLLSTSVNSGTAGPVDQAGLRQRGK